MLAQISFYTRNSQLGFSRLPFPSSLLLSASPLVSRRSRARRGFSSCPTTLSSGSMWTPHSWPMSVVQYLRWLRVWFCPLFGSKGSIPRVAKAIAKIH